MRFRIFFIYFLLTLIFIVGMFFASYINLEAVFLSQIRVQMERDADFLASGVAQRRNQDMNAKEKDLTIREFMDDYTSSAHSYAWLADAKGDFLHFPASETADRNFVKQNVNPTVIKEGENFFQVGRGYSGRFIYWRKVSTGGGYVVLSSPAGVYEQTRGQFVRRMLIFMAGFVLIALAVFMFLSWNMLLPLSHLQELSVLIAGNKDISEPLEIIRNDPDVGSIANLMAELYNSSRNIDFDDENPLSGLPGNRSLISALSQWIEQKEHFAVGYVDGNDFYAYRNKYGREKANSLIRFIGVITVNAIKEKGNPEDRIYHLGSDRFFFLTTPDRTRDICEKIISDYDSQLDYYYDSDAVEKGFIISRDKDGREGEYPFMPLCIAVATTQNRPLTKPLQIGHIVGEIRNYLRDSRKSAYHIDRRKEKREQEMEGTLSPFRDDKKKS